MGGGMGGGMGGEVRVRQREILERRLAGQYKINVDPLNPLDDLTTGNPNGVSVACISFALRLVLLMLH